MSYTLKYYLDGSYSESKLAKEVATLTSKEEQKELLKEFEKRKQTKHLPVFLYLRFNNKTVKVFSDRKCTQEQWDAKAQEVNPRKFKAGAPQFNKYLKNLKEQCEEIHLANVNNQLTTTKEDLKAAVLSLNGVSTENHRLSEPSYEEMKEKYLKVSNDRLAHNTIKKINTTFSHLEDFAAKKKVKIHWQLFDLDFEDHFVHYLYNKKNPLGKNSVSKYMKQLKTFLRFCLKHGINIDRSFEDYDTEEKEQEVHVLSKEELDALYAHEFKSKALNQVRDVFCFACFTGLRFADVANLSHENVFDDYLDLVIQKTQVHTQIPLIPRAKEILNRYKNDDSPLPVISNQKTNDHLKEIGKELKFDELVPNRVFGRREVKVEYLPKRELLTFHVARRTFTTLSLVLGMSETAVKSITGHKSQKEFNKYVNLSKKMLGDEAMKAWG